MEEPKRGLLDWISRAPNTTDQLRFDAQRNNQVKALDPHDLTDIVRVTLETRLPRNLDESVLGGGWQAREAVFCPVGFRP